MRSKTGILASLLAAAAVGPLLASAHAQPQSARVVDRVVAHIEGDIILQSQVRELAAFQQLIEGRAEPDDQLLTELIEQWVVQTEASAAHFPQPVRSEVDREVARLAAQFTNPQAYAAKLNEQGLSPTQVWEVLARQIYVERFLDYKFRPSVQIEATDVQAYYQKELLPQLARENRPAPQLADVEPQIREFLTQRGITALAVKWIEETKSRLKIELVAPGPQP